MSDFASLTLALEDWFDRPLGDLPEALRLRAEQELRPHRWEDLSPEHRRSLTLQLDYQHDPATERNREHWWDFFHRMSALEAELAREGASDRVNLDELLEGSGRLKHIRDKIRRMKARGNLRANRDLIEELCGPSARLPLPLPRPESQLPCAISYSRSRPFPVIRSAEESARQRPPSKYSCH